MFCAFPGVNSAVFSWARSSGQLWTAGPELRGWKQNWEKAPWDSGCSCKSKAIALGSRDDLEHLPLVLEMIYSLSSLFFTLHDVIVGDSLAAEAAAVIF